MFLLNMFPEHADLTFVPVVIRSCVIAKDLVKMFEKGLMEMDESMV